MIWGKYGTKCDVDITYNIYCWFVDLIASAVKLIKSLPVFEHWNKVMKYTLGPTWHGHFILLKQGHEVDKFTITMWPYMVFLLYHTAFCVQSVFILSVSVLCQLFPNFCTEIAEM